MSQTERPFKDAAPVHTVLRLPPEVNRKIKRLALDEGTTKYEWLMNFILQAFPDETDAK